MESNEFKTILKNITGVDLINHKKKMKFDCHVHLYSKGHYLLPHDDSIGERKLAYILYLTDPDQPWDPKLDGGRLEFYKTKKYKLVKDDEFEPSKEDQDKTDDFEPSYSKEHPEVNPSNYLEPKWNRFSCFEVRENVSWHGVEEIKSDAMRLSIQGWYHEEEEQLVDQTSGTETSSNKEAEQKKKITEEVLNEWDRFSLKYLQEVDDQKRSDNDLVYEKSVLTKSDVTKLRELDIRSSIFEDREAVQQMRNHFIEHGVLVIPDFLNYSDALNSEVKTNFPEQHVEQIGPPCYWRYDRVEIQNLNDEVENSEKNGSSLLSKYGSFFQSSTFRALVTELTGCIFTHYDTSLRRFKSGSDFTLCVAPLISDRLTATYVVSAGEYDDNTGGLDYLVKSFVDCHGNQIDDGGDNNESESGNETANSNSENNLVTVDTRQNALLLILKPEETPLFHYIKYLTNGTQTRVDFNSDYIVD